MSQRHDVDTIEVRGFSTSTSDETLVSFFENKRKSGGGDITKSHIDRTNNVFTATFEQQGVAKRVLDRRDLILDGATLKVSQVQVWDGKTIKVSGIQSSSTKDTIELFFENKRHSGGDAVSSIQRDKDKTTAYVTFENAGVAERVIAMRSLCLDGATLTVKKATGDGCDLQTSGCVDKNLGGKFSDNSFLKRDQGAEMSLPHNVWDGKTIEVSGLKATTTNDTIKLFFESNKRSGGDTVKEILRHKQVTSASVTFEKSGVAEKVLSRGTFTLEGSILTVKKATGRGPAVTPPVTRHEGGRAGPHVSVVPVEYSGDFSPTKGVPMESRTSRNQKPDTAARPRDVTTTTVHAKAPAPRPAAPRNMVVVRGINEKTEKETLKMWFENKKRSSGGPVDNIDYKRFQHEATITFQNVEDAQRVLQQGHFTLEDAHLTVTEIMVDDNTKHQTTGELDTVQKRKPPSRVKDNAPVRMVKITGLPPDTSTTVIEMFIENKSGETELESCDFDADIGVAVVGFKSPQGATNLMNAGRLVLKGAHLTVTALSDIYVGLDRESCQPKAVKVSGISSQTSKDFLSVFFENRHKSGGGDIEHLEYDDSDGTAVITFEEADSASRVAQKAPLIIQGKQVQVKLMRPSVHLTDVQGPFEDDTFLLSGVCPKCTGDDVKKFFSTTDSDSKVAQVIFTQQPGVVMLRFAYPPPEFYSLRELCVTKPLRGSMICVQRVAQTQRIQVHNIGSLNEEVLRMYFENKKSGGSRVIDLRIYANEDYAIVDVADNSTVGSILARGNHSFDNQTLYVAAFYDSVGVISPQQDPSRPGGWIPKSATVTGLDACLVSFISASSSSRGLMEDKMAEVYATVKWDTYSDTSRTIELTCTVTHSMKNAQQLAKTWSKDAPKAFLDVVKKEFASEEVSILQQAWEKFVGCITYTEDQDRDKVITDVDANACIVRVTGQRKEVHNVSDRLKHDHSRIQEDITRLSKFVTEVNDRLELHHIRMLNAKAFKSEQEGKFRDMKVVVDAKSLKVEFRGMPEDVMSAKTAMLDILNNITEKSVPMSGPLIGIVNGLVMKKQLVEQFKTKHICAVFDNKVESKTLMVYALNDKDLEVAVNTIKIYTEEQTLHGDVTNMADIEKWRKLVNKLESEHDGLLAIWERSEAVVVSGAEQSVDQAVEEVKRFLEENAVSEKFVELELGVADYLKKYMEQDVSKVIGNIKHVTAKVETDGRCGIVVTGYDHNLQQAMDQLQRLAQRITIDQLVIDKPGMPKYLHSQGGKMSLKDLESEHQVVIVDESQQVSKGDSSMNGGGRAVGSKVDLMSSATIEVVQGDLTRFTVDAIVNAANGKLKHMGGLARAISQAGGPEIQRESDDYVRANGVLTAGQVCMSTAGRLPCKKVIHAVGPRWKGGHNNEATDLYDATYGSLQIAEDEGLSSVAFPALSCGIFGYPVKQATETIITALKDFLEDPQHRSVKKVSLVDQSDKIVRELNNSLGVVFGSRVMVSAQPAQESSHETAARQPPPPSSGHTRKRSAPTSTGLSTPEGIKLLLSKSELAKEKVDAIVNSTNAQLRLDKGFVSKALLDKGGRVLQDECQKYAPNGIRSGEVVVTSGGQLHCKIVIHGACCRWDGPRSEQILRTLISNCLQEAHNHKVTSIAVPPIGIGRLGFDPHLVASLMREEVFEFSRQFPRTSLREVRFVVYHKDTPSIQAFEDELCDSVPSSHDTGHRQPPASTRYDEAPPSPPRRSVMPTASGSTGLKTPEGITMSLHQSEIVNERVDAIVNSTNRQLKLDTGFVSKAILNKGGKKIQQECLKKAPNGIESGEVVVTSGGKLGCKFVIHGACCKWDGGAGASEQVLRTLLSNCFQEAHNHHVTSLSIPPIGVGGLGFDAHFVASVMRDELFEFSRRNQQTCLREVRFVVYHKDSACIQAFQDVLSGRTPDRTQGHAGARPKQHQGPPRGGHVEGRSAANKQSVTLIIYAQSRAVIACVKQAIESQCTAECPDVVLDSKGDQEAITKLTQVEIAEIQSLEERCNVKITIHNGKNKQSIHIQGLKVDTSEAHVHISDIFRHVEVATVKKLQDSLIAKTVHWSYADGDKYKDYPEDINSLLEEAFQEQKPTYTWKETDGVNVTVDLKKLVETTSGSRTVLPVRRSIVGDDSIKLPTSWTRMHDGEDVKLVDIQKGSAEFNKVEKKFMSTANGTVKSVIKIERVQNPAMYRLYMIRKADMEKRKNKPKTVERSLWHGTDVGAVGSINTAGFNRSYCGKNATMFGKGVYFAVNTEYPAGRGYARADSNGHKRIYKSLVLTGDFAQGAQDIPVPPPNPSNPGFNFDSTVNDVSNPIMFIVFLDGMAYPEYLITFT